eukprot:1352529-Amorphochlora_amoeboformis.AAC.1
MVSHNKFSGDDCQALIWDLSPLPKPIVDPILAYNAEAEINSLEVTSNIQLDPHAKLKYPYLPVVRIATGVGGYHPSTTTSDITTVTRLVGCLRLLIT